eukprot:jgi/Psemu1/3561/gm1.3561_g
MSTTRQPAISKTDTGRFFQAKMTTLAGFEPTRDEPSGFQVHRLNHSATVSAIFSGTILMMRSIMSVYRYIETFTHEKGNNGFGSLRDVSTSKTVGFRMGRELIIIIPKTSKLDPRARPLSGARKRSYMKFRGNEMIMATDNDVFALPLIGNDTTAAFSPILVLSQPYENNSFHLISLHSSCRRNAQRGIAQFTKRPSGFLVIAMMEWLASRPENETPVVTHSPRLKHLVRAFGRNIHEKDKSKMHRVSRNAEVRSIYLACQQGSHLPGTWVGDTDSLVPDQPSFLKERWASTNDQIAGIHEIVREPE